MTPYSRTPCSLKILAMRQAFSTASTNFLRSLGVAHGGAADGARPDRRDERADLEAVRGDLVGHGA